MTTIAYNHKDQEIACDGRMTMYDTVVNDDAVKMKEFNGVKFFFCGKSCDEDLAISIYFGGEAKKQPNVSGFVIDGCSVYHISFSEDCDLQKFKVDCNMAIGSGTDFALSAMDFGCNAEDAVKYAATRDIYSGGKISVFKVPNASI